MGEFLEGLGSRLEQEPIDHPLVSQGYRPELLGKRKNHMEVPCRQEFPLPGRKPPLLVQALAFGTVTIPAGIVRYPLGSAVVALVHMAS